MSFVSCLIEPHHFSLVKDEKLINVFRWEQKDGKELICVSRKILQEGKQEENLVFYIYNDTGSIVYQADFGKLGSIKKIYSVYALREDQPQLAVEVNSGGSGSILYLLDYRNEKVLNLIDSNESDFDVSCEIKPQFKSVNDARKLPFQIYLTSQIASFSEPQTRVFSLENGKYIFKGKFQTSKLEAYYEKLLK